MIKKTYPRNHIIYKQGEIANNVYFIESGEVQTSRYSDIVSDDPNLII